MILTAEKIALLQSTINNCVTILEEARDAEQEALDDLSEEEQASSEGEAIQDIITILEEAIDYANNAESSIDGLKTS